MSTISLTCRCCKVQFEYAQKEFKRQTKLGRNEDEFYCSRSCARRWKNANRSDEEKAAAYKNLHERLKGNQYSRKGLFTQYLNKARHRGKDFNLDEEYLSSIWTGKCALTKIDIINTPNKTSLKAASLDRIDSSKGYIKGNVQFVSYGINLAKNSFSDDEVLQFINEIRTT